MIVEQNLTFLVGQKNGLWCFDGLWNAEKQRYRNRDMGREHLEHNVRTIVMDSASERVVVIVIRQIQTKPYSGLK